MRSIKFSCLVLYPQAIIFFCMHGSERHRGPSDRRIQTESKLLRLSVFCRLRMQGQGKLAALDLHLSAECLLLAVGEEKEEKKQTECSSINRSPTPRPANEVWPQCAHHHGQGERGINRGRSWGKEIATPCTFFPLFFHSAWVIGFLRLFKRVTSFSPLRSGTARLRAGGGGWGWGSGGEG